MNKNFFGFFCAATAAVTFGLNPLFATALYSAGVSAPTVLFYRFLCGAAMLALLMAVKKQSFCFERKYAVSLISLALLLAGTSLGLFLSFRYIDMGIASTILFAYPVIVAFVMGMVFKEKITLLIVTSIIMSLVGIIVLCRTSNGTFISIPGILLALLSAFSYAIYMIVLRKSNVHELPSLQVTFYAMLFSLVFFVVIPDFKFVIPLESKVILNLLGLGFFPAFLSFYTLAVGIRYIGATKCSIIGALEPLVAVCISLLLTGESPTWRLGIGLVLILGAVGLVISSDSKKTAEVTKEKTTSLSIADNC